MRAKDLRIYEFVFSTTTGFLNLAVNGKSIL